jgi:6-phosphogluconolactonase (cycloisomerase 2 family)
MTVNSSGRVAFVSNAGSSNVSGFIVNSGTGFLTPASVLPFAAGTTPQTLTLEPFEKFAFVADFGADTVSVYSVNTTTGILTPVPGAPFSVAPGSQPQQATVVTIGAAVQFVYLANAATSNVSGFFLNTTNGFLTAAPGSPFAVGAAPQSVVADSLGQFVYVSNSGAASVSAFSVNQTNGGLLNTVIGAPFAAGTTPKPVTLHPTKPFAYVANAGSSNISAYSVNSVTGVLSTIPNPGPPVSNFFSAGISPQQVTIDPTGKFALVANAGSSNVSVYAIDQAIGSLTQVAGSPFATGTQPHRVTVDPTATFVIVPNVGSNDVSVYQFNSTTGFLTPVAGSPFAAGVGPEFVATVGTF